MLSGGPDGLAYAVCLLLNGIRVRGLHCIPSDCTHIIDKQQKLLFSIGEYLGTEIAWVTLYEHWHPMICYHGALSFTANKFNTERVITGVTAEDNPQEDYPFQEMFELTNPDTPLDNYTPASKDTIRDLLGPLVKYTVSCQSECGQCKKCKERKRHGIEKPDLNYPESELRMSFLKYQNTQTFKDALDDISKKLSL